MAREIDERWVVDEDTPLPSQMSVTLGVKADACPRDAHLYLKHRGQSSAGPLLRGSLAHLAFERIITELMVRGEESLFAPQPGEDPLAAAAEVSQTTKEWVDALAEETGWPLSEAEIDEARVMAYHMAIGNAVDPVDGRRGRAGVHPRAGGRRPAAGQGRPRGDAPWTACCGSGTTRRRSTCRRARTSRR
jgi:hypothetical protein